MAASHVFRVFLLAFRSSQTTCLARRITSVKLRHPRDVTRGNVRTTRDLALQIPGVLRVYGAGSRGDSPASAATLNTVSRA
jgi:hypothetical protein